MEKIIITEKNSNQRIDKFLSKEFFSYSRGELIRQIKSGNVKVNDKIVKPSYLLKEGDVVSVNSEQRTGNKIEPNKKIKLSVIFSDENIIVVNKPAGIQIHPDYNEKENTVVNALLSKFPEIRAVGDNPNIRPGIVHRLDKDTSGVLLVARNQKAFLELKKQFQERTITKKYLALVWGRLENKKGIINKPLARSEKYKKQVVAGKKTKTKIREAVTEYNLLDEFGEHSLVEVAPKTGRLHQIRVHMKSIGHPVVGDKVYKDKKRKVVSTPDRQLLHAKKLEFTLFGHSYNFSAPLPLDFQEFLKTLTKGR